MEQWSLLEQGPSLMFGISLVFFAWILAGSILRRREVGLSGTKSSLKIQQTQLQRPLEQWQRPAAERLDLVIKGVYNLTLGPILLYDLPLESHKLI